ncbi:putative disease resistance protein RGA1 [Lotus japonicus]|uniref:putative disease resistance protein RGA1 n=1 Tax=Lotus japonicus TaxID=34305 RepID=UPI002590F6AD|nr:putative disease resistance protein RGA1 [Lotus japonicus]
MLRRNKNNTQLWLEELKDAVYELDGIFDEYSIKSLGLRGFSFFKPKNIMFRYEISKRLKEITRRFDEIAKRGRNFTLDVEELQTGDDEWRQTISIDDQSQIYGRDDDKKRTVEFLLKQARGSHFLSIYPIVGLGAVGKTTLAYLVFNDESVNNNFSVKIWVCVSKSFSIKRILSSIIEAVTHEKYDTLQLDEMESKVQELLQNKRYLLVLDDVWALMETTWNEVKFVLSCGSKGACILVTTRDKKVAAIMGTCQAHYLVGLSEDQSWLLFKKCAFGPGKEVSEESVAIGKEIMKRCGGLPPSIRELGIQCSRNEDTKWHIVRQQELWMLSSQIQTFRTLMLSYFDLSPMSRECYAFCVIFPKDTEIIKEDIIHLWMANGFISSRGNLEVEDVGSAIWDELCQKLFFQDIKVDDSSGDISFKMHYLIHELAQLIMRQECLLFDYENMRHLRKSVRHVSFHGDIVYDEVLERVESFFLKLERVKSMRTLYELELHGQGNILLFPLTPPLREIHTSSFKLPHSLRVIRTSSLKLLPLKNLIHLRYLELYGFAINKLYGPFIDTLLESISSLQKLEILKLKHFSNLICLPKQFTSLKNLRHLATKCCYSLSRMFPDIRKLSRLRTLNVYIVGSEAGHTLAELHDLELGGKLSLEGLENVDSLSDAQDANLVSKENLQDLSFSWYRRDILDLSVLWYQSGETESPAINVEHVLEGLRPPLYLKKLRIHQYEGLSFCFPWILHMRSLVVLELHDCRNVQRLSSLGLLSLRKLKIQDMDNMQYMDDDDDESYDDMEFRAFPSLEELELRGLPKLERLLKAEKRNMFPLLSHLYIFYCPKLVLPHLPSLKSLQLYVCNNEVLRPISSFNALTSLELSCGDKYLTSFPEGIMRNLASLETLVIYNFPRLKKIPNELINLNALRHLEIIWCEELESLPEEGWESLCSVLTLKFYLCSGLRSLPEGVRRLTSLEVLEICLCPTLGERCKKGIGEDWEKIQHIPKVIVDGIYTKNPTARVGRIWHC